MFNLISEASQLFSNMISYREVAAEANTVLSCTVSQLPDVDELEIFLNSFCKCDLVELSIRSYMDFMYPSTSPNTWKSEYCEFIKNSNADDNVEINLHINKFLDDRGSLSIYSFESFMQYYNSLPLSKLLQELSSALKKRTRLSFHVIDKEINLSTYSICFYNDISMLTSSIINREEHFAHLSDASLFLNRNDLPLFPNDFRISHDVSFDSSELTTLLEKLETIFSYIYLSYSAHIVNDQIVLQLSPCTSNITLTYPEVVPCRYICDLFQWAFDGDYTIERVGIVRNLLELNCKNVSDLSLKDESLLLSAKSNYILFQKKTIDKYIELKNSISLTIVEATSNMQEIFQTLVDAVRNNFIAVIMFLITVIITDSISWDDLTNGAILNSDLLLVIKVFCISSFLYLLVTLISIFVKWCFFSRGYKDIKANYENLLDADDLRRAFDNDKAIKRVRNIIIIVSLITTVVWIAFLLLIYILIR